MEQADILALPGATWEAGYLEDTSVRRLVVEVYDREHVAIQRYVAFLGIDTETSQEIVQDTFLKLHEHLLRGGDRGNLRAWLYKVAHNLSRNSQLAFRSSKTDALPDNAGSELRAQALSVEDELVASERVQILRRAMNQLSPAQRECLVLRTQGLKYREIAEITNLSISTVGEHVQRGLEKLKELI